MIPLADSGRVLPFRRRRFLARHRRRARWLTLLRALLTALAVVGMPVAAVAWASTASHFQLRRIEARGTARVGAEWMGGALASFHGQNIFWLSLGAVRERIAAHPWVAAAEVRKRLPDGLEVRVAERQPVALWRRGSALLFVDGEGERIAPFAPAVADAGPGGEDLLLVSAGHERQVRVGLALAARLAELEPVWGRALSEVEAVSDEDYRLHVEGVPFALLVSGERLDGALADYRRWAPALERTFGDLATMDLRFPGRIVIEPAAPVAAVDGGEPPTDPGAPSLGNSQER